MHFQQMATLDTFDMAPAKERAGCGWHHLVAMQQRPTAAELLADISALLTQVIDVVPDPRSTRSASPRTSPASSSGR
jgi:hypothetical protein